MAIDLLSGVMTSFDPKKATDPHYKHQVSFSGADVKAIIHIPNDAGINPIDGGRKNDIIPNSAIALSGLQTLSISIYRDKSPVRSLGFVNPVGITRGGRTIAGSMIFTILQKHPLIQLNGRYTYDYNNEFGWGWKGGHGDQFFPDACPPFNLHMIFANEVGNRGLINLYGVEFTNDGTVASIEDILTENTYQWMARDMKVYHNVEAYFKDDGTWQFTGGFDEAGFTRNSTGGEVQKAFNKVGLFGDRAKNPEVALLQYAIEDTSWIEPPGRTSNHQPVPAATGDPSAPNETNTEVSVKVVTAATEIIGGAEPLATVPASDSAASSTSGTNPVNSGIVLGGGLEPGSDSYQESPAGTGSSSSTTTDRPDDDEIEDAEDPVIIGTSIEVPADTFSPDVPHYPGSSPAAPQQQQWAPAESVSVYLEPEEIQAGPDGELGTGDDVDWSHMAQTFDAMAQAGRVLLESWNIDPDNVTVLHRATFVEQYESAGQTVQMYDVRYSWEYNWDYMPPQPT